MTEPVFNTQVVVTLISTLGAVVGTYLTVKYKDHIVKMRRKSEPKDRMETIFDGYENLIKQQQQDIARKSILIDHLERAMRKLAKELDESKRMIDQLKTDIEDATEQNTQLRQQLVTLKKEYAGESA